MLELSSRLSHLLRFLILDKTTDWAPSLHSPRSFACAAGLAGQLRQ